MSKWNEVFITSPDPELDGDSDGDSGEKDGGGMYTMLEEVFSKLIPLQFFQMEKQ